MPEKRVLITGVSSGIGWALAQNYLSLGYQVYACSRRRPEGMDEKNLFFSQIDLANLDKLKKSLASLTEGIEHFNLVILNAAALGEIKDLGSCSIPYLKNMMDINLWANKLICDSLFERHIQVKQVVAISSGASLNGNRGWNGYALSKAALNMMMQLYAKEQSKTHFNSLAPGLVETAMLDYLCALKETEKYPSLVRLHKARGTEKMPSPQAIAPRLVEAFEKLLTYPNGSYVDIRKMGEKTSS